MEVRPECEISKQKSSLLRPLLGVAGLVITSPIRALKHPIRSVVTFTVGMSLLIGLRLFSTSGSNALDLEQIATEFANGGNPSWEDILLSMRLAAAETNVKRGFTKAYYMNNTEIDLPNSNYPEAEIPLYNLDMITFTYINAANQGDNCKYNATFNFIADPQRVKFDASEIQTCPSGPKTVSTIYDIGNYDDTGAITSSQQACTVMTSNPNSLEREDLPISSCSKLKSRILPGQ